MPWDMSMRDTGVDVAPCRISDPGGGRRARAWCVCDVCVMCGVCARERVCVCACVRVCVKGREGSQGARRSHREPCLAFHCTLRRAPSDPNRRRRRWPCALPAVVKRRSG
jgi:hypothetical protein